MKRVLYAVAVLALAAGQVLAADTDNENSEAGAPQAPAAAARRRRAGFGAPATQDRRHHHHAGGLHGSHRRVERQERRRVIGSSFGSVPYNNAATSKLSEFRFSPQNSRIGFRVDGDWKGAHFIGYNEFDFLGTSGVKQHQRHQRRLRAPPPPVLGGRPQGQVWNSWPARAGAC